MVWLGRGERACVRSSGQARVCPGDNVCACVCVHKRAVCAFVLRGGIPVGEALSCAGPPVWHGLWIVCRYVYMCPCQVHAGVKLAKRGGSGV